jgi:hypothetical protein
LRTESLPQEAKVTETFKRGEKVEWNYRGHVISGKVRKRLTERTEVDGRVYNAWKEDPRYVVRADKSGKEIARRPGALTRING